MTEERSAWSPLKNSLFRSLWIATIVSNIGTWMQDVGAGWLMTSLSSSPSMVALVEAAESFPLMLLALPAGALADIVDRRRLLIAIQTYLLIVAGALAILTLLDMTRYTADTKDHVYLQRIREHLQSGRDSGVRHTPTFFVNRKIHEVSFGLDSLFQAVEATLGPKSPPRRR